MARKTFISYKYSEARGLRDVILKSLGTDAIYYQGETSDSPDLTDTSTENIKNHLRNMIYETSVTIVVISPNMKESKWIDWEIEYSLKEITRENRRSRTNGVLGVIMKQNGGCNWLIRERLNGDGCKSRSIESSDLYPIIRNNRYNLKKPEYVCRRCMTVGSLSGSYISLIEEEEFLEDASYYIENAFEKCQRIDDFELCKTR